MQSKLFILALSAASFGVSAQDVNPVYPKNEIGFLGAASLGEKAYVPAKAGIHYTRYIRPSVSYRIGAGYASFEEDAQPFLRTATDSTLTTTHLNHLAGLGYLSFGLQTQRTFYKKVVLYAGADLSYAFGKGSADSVFTTEGLIHSGPNEAPVTSGTLPGIRYSFANASPYLGIKLVLRKWVLGTEATAVHLSYVSEKYPTTAGSAGLIDFNIGSLEQRFYVGWRF